MGNGRTGDFFSFEFAGINPDMVTISKSIGGGLPMAMLLIKPELDQWHPGEHTGTFRGNNLAFVAATIAINQYWNSDDLSNAVRFKEKIIRERLLAVAGRHPEYEIEVRGRGMVYGFEIKNDYSIAGEISAKAFEHHLVIETAGSANQVVKFLPPLLIDEETLTSGLDRFEQAVEDVFKEKQERLTTEY